MKAKIILLACASSLAWCNAAAAQTGAAPTADTVESDNNDEIVVTATKRNETAQDVSISLNVFDGEELTEKGIADLGDLATLVPGLVYQDSPILPYVSLRGFGTGTGNPGYDHAVAIYIDGIFAGRGRQFQAPFFDQERVEILLGPQGALLGKNSSAGAINFVSARPRSTFQAGLTTTYLFDRQGVDAAGYVTGPVSDTLNLRLAAHMLTEGKGYVYNTATKESDPRTNVFSARLTADWNPSDGISSLARFEYNNLRIRGTQAGNQPAGPLFSTDPYVRNFAGTFGRMDGLELETWQFSNTAEIALGEHTLASITGLQGFNGGNVGGTGLTNPEYFGIMQFEEWFQASQELRIVSPENGKFEWIAGIYGDTSDYDVDYKIDYSLLNNTVVGKASSPFKQTAQTLSAYATGTLHLAETLRAIGGLRYTYGHRSGAVKHVLTSGVVFGFVNGNAASDKISESHLDPSLAVEWDFAPDNMVYFSYASGSKSGAFQANSRTVTPATFVLRPEKATGFEIGIKTKPARWLTFNLALFQLTIEDLHSAQFVGTPPQLISVNAAEARSRGAEWTLILNPTRGLSFTMLGTYLDAKYTDYPNAPCTDTQVSIPTGCDAKGRPLSAQAKWTGSATLDYDTSVTDGLRAFGSVTANYQSRQNIDANRRNPIWGFQDPYTKVNARIGFGDADRSWELALVAKNLFNKKTINSTFPWGPPFLPRQTIVVRPDPTRSVGVQFKMTLK